MYWFYGIGQKQKTGFPQPVFPLFQEDEIQDKDDEQPVHNRVNAFSFSFADHCNRVEYKTFYILPDYNDLQRKRKKRSPDYVRAVRHLYPVFHLLEITEKPAEESRFFVFVLFRKTNTYYKTRFFRYFKKMKYRIKMTNSPYIIG